MIPSVKVWGLGLMSFGTALKIQTTLARKQLDCIKTGSLENLNTLIFVEHKPVYTIGIRDQTPEKEIRKLTGLGAEFYKTNRGGLITFHGPGQLVVYPILNLKDFKPSVKWYVDRLEETVIRLCGDYGLQASRSPHTGVWLGDNKIAAIGIHASRYVTTHGIAINCDTDLEWFSHIVPCGIEGKGVTSLSKATNEHHTVSSVAPVFLDHFQEVFSCKAQVIDMELQNEILKTVVNGLTEVKFST